MLVMLEFQKKKNEILDDQNIELCCLGGLRAITVFNWFLYSYLLIGWMTEV